MEIYGSMWKYTGPWGAFSVWKMKASTYVSTAFPRKLHIYFLWSWIYYHLCTAVGPLEAYFYLSVDCLEVSIDATHRPYSYEVTPKHLPWRQRPISMKVGIPPYICGKHIYCHPQQYFHGSIACSSFFASILLVAFMEVTAASPAFYTANSTALG